MASAVEEKDRNSELHVAAEGGDFKMVELLLQRGEDVNIRTDFLRRTPLILAARAPYVGVCEMLLSHSQCDANAQDELGRSALHEAAEKGSVHICRLLLDRGAQVDIRTHDGFTPLHLAARAGHLMVTNLLVQKGADPLAKTKDGKTASYFAVEERHRDMSVYLQGEMDICRIQSEASAFLPPRRSYSPFFTEGNVFAPRPRPLAQTPQPSEGVAQSSPQSPAQHPPPSEAQMLLYTSAKQGLASKVHQALENGAEVNHAYQDQSTALHLAAKYGHEDVVRRLLECNAASDVKDKHGDTPLHLATRNEHYGVVRVLVAEDLSLIDIKNGQNKTALEIAIILKNTQIERFLKEIK